MNPTEAIEDQKKLKTAKINLAGKNVKKAQIIAAKSIGNKQYPKTQTDWKKELFFKIKKLVFTSLPLGP